MAAGGHTEHKPGSVHLRVSFLVLSAALPFTQIRQMFILATVRDLDTFFKNVFQPQIFLTQSTQIFLWCFDLLGSERHIRQKHKIITMIKIGEEKTQS